MRYDTLRIFLAIPEKDKCRRKVEETLFRLGIKFSNYKADIYFHDHEIYEFLKQCGNGAANKKIPKWLLDYSPKFLLSLINGLMDSDGSRGRTYTTVSERLVKDFVELALKLGYYPSFTKRFSSSSIEGRKIEGYSYDIYLASHEPRLGRIFGSSLIENYNGKIWCVKVKDNHNFLVERNGKVAFSGNSEEYGNQTDFPLKEDAELRPNSPYSASKVASDKYLQYMRDAYDFPITILRPFNTYGRKEDTHFVVERAITQMLQNKTIRLGDKTPIRDLLYVDDHVNAYLVCLRNKRAIGEIFNFCTGQGTSIKKLVDLLVKLVGFDGEILWDAIPARPLDIQKLVGSYDKAKRVLGWRPKYTLEKGLKPTVEYWRNKLAEGAMHE